LACGFKVKPLIAHPVGKERTGREGLPAKRNPLPANGRYGDRDGHKKDENNPALSIRKTHRRMYFANRKPLRWLLAVTISQMRTVREETQNNHCRSTSKNKAAEEFYPVSHSSVK
jgi:hypothetical protein